MASCSLIVNLTKCQIQGNQSIYISTGICPIIAESETFWNLLKKVLITPFKFMDKIKHSAEHYRKISAQLTHLTLRRLSPKKYVSLNKCWIWESCGYLKAHGLHQYIWSLNQIIPLGNDVETFIISMLLLDILATPQ